jgi:hypothetical protein
MAEIITAKHSSDAGHWYDSDGNPAYTIIGKNGNERPTTLRDARKLALRPSVTTIIAAGNAPALVEWKINQAILSALTATRGEEETESDFVSRIKADAKEQARKAAERGTMIHAWIQSGIENGFDEKTEGYEYLCSAMDTILKSGIMDGHRNTWICEKPFATERYGGKADIHNENYLIDIKTKTWTDKDKLDIWESHLMQLAAYRHGLNIPDAKCGILYVHQDTAESVLLWADEDKLKQGMGMFNGLLDFYYAKTKLGRENNESK